MKKITVQKMIEVTIDQCHFQCPYFGYDGYPNEIMFCEHPDAPENGYIIDIHNSKQGYPPSCPLIKDNPDLAIQSQAETQKEQSTQVPSIFGDTEEEVENYWFRS